MEHRPSAHPRALSPVRAAAEHDFDPLVTAEMWGYFMAGNAASLPRRVRG